MTSYRLVTAADSQRTEAEVRELARAKIRAKAAYDAFAATAINFDATEEQKIDVELEGKRLWNIYYAASLALTAAV